MDNNLFYTCSLIEYMGRTYLVPKREVIKSLGKDNVGHIYDLADIYHCDNIDAVCEHFDKMVNFPRGKYDIITGLTNPPPTFWDIGKVYARIIEEVYPSDYVTGIVEVMSSWLADNMDFYDSATYYSGYRYLALSYKEGHLLGDEQYREADE